MNDLAHQAGTDDTRQVVLAENRNQVLDALNRLDINPAKLPRLPWDGLHDVIGPIWPTDILVLAAATGNGKTTVAAHIVEAWVKAGKRVYFLALEQKPAELRTALAALANNLHPQRVLENRWDRLPRGAEAAIRGTLKAQVADLEGRLVFSPAADLTLDSLGAEMTMAHSLGADIVVIDHVQHVDLGRGNQHEALRRFCRLLKEFVNAFDLPVLLLAQLHRGEKDPIAPYQPPNPYSIEGGEVIRQVCSVALGIYRPLVDTFDAEDARAIRSGKKKIREYLQPDAISFHVMKHRLRAGEAIGELVHLTYRHGRIVCQRTEAREAQEERYSL